jgi:hypothetical protein
MEERSERLQLGICYKQWILTGLQTNNLTIIYVLESFGEVAESI